MRADHKQLKIEYVLGLTLAILLLWMLDDYLGFMISLIVIFLSMAVLLITFITQKVDFRPIPKWYYHVLYCLILIPLIIGIVYLTLFGYTLDWMTD